MCLKIRILRSFLNRKDNCTAQEQFNERYSGGWNPISQFSEFLVEWHKIKLHGMNVSFPTIYYHPDHPLFSEHPLFPIAGFRFRDQDIYIFPHGMVMVVDDPGGKNVKCELAKMDCVA